MTVMYVLERRVPRGAGKGRRYHWRQYAVCGRRTPLERVRLGLGAMKEWRIRKISVAGSAGCRAA